MAFTVNFDQSNKADWIIEISATDAETGDDIDFTGAAVKFVAVDENRCERLTATIGSGITQPSADVLEVAFSESQMNGLCAGSYNVGCVAQLSTGEKVQVLVGTVSVYDGWANL